MSRVFLLVQIFLIFLMDSLLLSSQAKNQVCKPATLYNQIKNETTALEKNVRKSLGSRPGMKIQNVLWTGSGQFKLICHGQYPEVRAFAPSEGPAVDRSKINHWHRGDGSAESPGRYIFQTDQHDVSIPILSINSEQLSDYGVIVTSSGDRFNTPKPSVMATYLYGANYFNDFVFPENGPRLERHPNDHLVTLMSKIDNKKSYFVVGRVINGVLSVAAIELQIGVTLRIRGNTVHTNDYVTGVVQEIYPKSWGVDEVRLVNRSGLKVRLVPTEKNY